ncbi:MAG: diguanylate cyclase [Herbaspirillum sp.]|nr:diguanylate cyclase [Herbaspirillum sp.]
MSMRLLRDRVRLIHDAWIAALGHGLARRMLVWIVCISATAALVATSVQLFFDYRRDVSALEEGMRYIEQSQLPGLADAAWNFNVASMQVQLDGIGRSPWVSGATIHYGPSQSAELSTGHVDPHAARFFDYVLRRNGAVVGKITIAANLQTLYERTMERIVIVLCTQIVKSLITSVSILLLVSWMITRHLTQMADFANAYSPGGTFRPFVLRRSPLPRQDELSVLVDRLNDAYARIEKAHEFEVRHNEILSGEVALRTAELRAAHQTLAKLAVTDKLTGVLNRLGLDAAFQEALAQADAQGRPLAVILADIDEFKSVNDQHGHLVGDSLLREFAAVLAAGLRESDILARWGGEEFLILCPDTGLEQAAHLAGHLRQVIQAHSFASVGAKTSSFGVAVWCPGESTDELMKRADDALYRAKKDGRNRVCLEAR